MVFGGIFGNNAVEPPTPPHNLDKNINDALDFLDDSFEITRALEKPPGRLSTVETPTPSPSSSAEPTKILRRSEKKVGWSPFTEYHKPADIKHRSPEHRVPLRPLPPTKASKPLRSILKPYDLPSPVSSSPNAKSNTAAPSPHTFDNFADMLQFVVRELASKSRDIRLDGYIALLGALRAYDGPPNTADVLSNLDLLTQFIERDLSNAGDERTTTDGNLETQAVNLLMALLRNPPVAEKMDSKFCAAIIERIIKALESTDSPKRMLVLYAQLLAFQKFTPKILTVERIQKILAGLRSIETRVSGNSIVGARLAAYQRLIELNPSVMLGHVSSWLDHLFHGMLSNIPEIRIKAIEVGQIAGRRLGTDARAFKALTEFLSVETEDNGSCLNALKARLEAMTPSREEGHFVPQIWVVVILLVRSRGRRLEQWQYLSDWLAVIQKCMNAPDIRTKYQASLAWNIFIAVINPDRTTSGTIRKKLRLPVTVGLNRKGSDQNAEQIRKFALSGYCTLLYYAFRPSAAAEDLDCYWDEYVVKLLSDSLSSNSKSTIIAWGVLTGLFGGFPPTPWYAERAYEIDGVFRTKGLKTRELPRLEPKWVRRNLGKVLPLVSQCLELSAWSNDKQEESPPRLMWESLMSTLSEAGNQEIQASVDLKSAVANLLGLFHTMWAAAVKPTESQQFDELRMDRLHFLVSKAIEKLGARAFIDTSLTRKGPSAFETAPTPSHRSRSSGKPQPAFLHFLKLVVSTPGSINSSQSSPSTFAKTLLEACCSAQSGRLARLTLLADSAEVVASSVADNGPSVLRSEAWQIIAQLVSDTLRGPSSITQGYSRQGKEFECALKVLGFGLQHASATSLDTATLLHHALVDVVRKEAGDGALALAVTEPLSEACASWRELSGADHGVALRFAALILTQGHHPDNRRSLEKGRQALWGEHVQKQKSTNFEPYTNLYTMSIELLNSAYDYFGILDRGLIKNFISGLSQFLASCSPDLTRLSVQKVQSGIVVWILDKDRKLESSKLIREAVLWLWKEVTESIRSSTEHNSLMLRSFEPLFNAGFRSHQKYVVNETIKLWNDTVGCEQALDYPPDIERALRRLRPLADLRLPTFPDSPEDIAPNSPVNFPESQEDVEVPRNTPARCGHSVEGPALTQLVPERNQRRSVTPARPVSRSKSSQTPKTRLRHEDSQLEFAPIDSSPLPGGLGDSQLLTDRQKEVRDRQLASTAALFPDIRSSPFSASRKLHGALGDLGISSDIKFTDDRTEDGPATPVLAPAHGPMDDFLYSSPTPASVPHSRSSKGAAGVAQHLATGALHILTDDPNVPSSPPPEIMSKEAGDQADDQDELHDETVVRDSFIARNSPSKESRPTEEKKPSTRAPSADLDTQTAAQMLESNIDGHDLEPSARFEQGGEDEGHTDVGGSYLDSMNMSSSVDPQLPAAQLVAEQEAAAVQSQKSMAESNGPPSETELPVEPAMPLVQESVSPRKAKNSENAQSAIQRLQQLRSDDSSAIFMDASEVPLREDIPEPEPPEVKRTTHALRPVIEDDAEHASSTIDVEDHDQPQDSSANATDRAQPENNVDDEPVVTPPSFVEDSFDKSLLNKADAVEQEGHGQGMQRASQPPLESGVPTTPTATGKRKRTSLGRKGEAKRRNRQSLQRSPSVLSVGEPDEDGLFDYIEVTTSRKTAPPAIKVELSPKVKKEASAAPAASKQKRKRSHQISTTAAFAGGAQVPVFGRRSSRLSAVTPVDDASNNGADIVPVAEGQAPKRRRIGSESGVSPADLVEVTGTDGPLPRANPKTVCYVEIPSSELSGRSNDVEAPAPPSHGRAATEGAPEPELSAPDPAGSARPGRAPDVVAPGETQQAVNSGKPSGSTTLDETGAVDATTTPQRITGSQSPGGRHILSPRSIIDRLKRLWEDCKQVVLNGQEEREVDDLLFEVRKEVHEAGRRGRG